MKNKLNKFKFELLVIAVLFSGCMVVLAQTIKDVNSSLGNAEAMNHNLNEPNATSPARNNFQNYERNHSSAIETEHPDADLANSYNRSKYEKK